MNRVRMTFGKPVVIAQASPEVKDWGYHQFPGVELLDDGGVHVHYHVERDSATTYGKASAHVVSYDGGYTFSTLEKKPDRSGILQPNGDRVRIKHLPSVLLDDIKIPEEIAKARKGKRMIYRAEDFPRELSGYPIERLRAGETEWHTEIKHVSAPHVVRYATEGVLPHQMFWRLRMAPDNKLWAIAYPYALLPGRPAECMPTYFVSDDNGETFTYLGSIPYQAIEALDDAHDKRNGFTEPDVAFMPDGSVISILRTENGVKGARARAPMYLSRSTDNGKTWSKPLFFDTLGVWPIIQTLKNGVTLVCYGRPGLYLRATADPSGLDWDERITVINPGHNKQVTCAYAEMTALDDTTAYFVYSDFAYPNADGVPVKTILGCTVTTAMD